MSAMQATNSARSVEPEVIVVIRLPCRESRAAAGGTPAAAQPTDAGFSAPSDMQSPAVDGQPTNVGLMLDAPGLEHRNPPLQPCRFLEIAQANEIVGDEGDADNLIRLRHPEQTAPLGQSGRA